VLPQTDDYIDRNPQFPNHPPRIVEQTLEPSQPVVPLSNGANCSLRFRVQVEDLDIQDRIRVYWYVDYYLNGRPPEKSEAIDNLGSGSVRPTTLEYVGTPSAPGSPLFTVGNHVVEALVADGEVLDRRNGRPEGKNDLPDGGPPTFFVIKPWFVQVEAQGDCPP
jgi:hypothetical protein